MSAEGQGSQQEENNNNNNNDPNQALLNTFLNFLCQQGDRNQNPPPPPPINNATSAFKAFKSLRPPEFQGSTDPVEARAWLKDMGKSFQILQIREDKKKVFVAYLLKGEANLR